MKKKRVLIIVCVALALIYALSFLFFVLLPDKDIFANGDSLSSVENFSSYEDFSSYTESLISDISSITSTEISSTEQTSSANSSTTSSAPSITDSRPASSSISSSKPTASSKPVVSSKPTTSSKPTVSSKPVSSSKPSSSTSTSSTVSTPPTTNSSFMRAIWIAYYDLDMKGANKATFQKKIDTMFDNAVSMNMTDVICHVRAFSDAFYYSDIFPHTKYLSGTEGKDPGYDALEYMIYAAKKRNLKFHAWLNPYRAAFTTDLSKLANNHPAKIWLTDNNTANDRYVLSAGGKYLYYNPAYADVRTLIIDGVKEILDNYDVDAIHIDDYFYPTTAESFDSVEYSAYKAASANNKLSLAEWRRANVNALVVGLNAAVHNYDDVKFGISPAANISRCYNELYADVEYWMKTTGFCDYIIPQIYYGYEYKTAKYQFTNLLNEWNSKKKHASLEFYIGLGPYKINQPTTNDGTEWENKPEILGKQVTDCYKLGTDGVAIFDYGTMLKTNDANKKAKQAMVDAFKAIK